MSHPGLQLLLLNGLMLWPLMRVYRRVGLSSFWVLLLAGDFFVPFLGLLLALAPLAFKRWPNFLASPKPAPPVKTAI